MLSMQPPQTVPSMQYVPQASQHMSHPAHPSQRPVFQQQPSFQQAPQAASRVSETAPAFSSRRIPAPSESRVVPASTRVPSRERATSNFPAFDTDWDVPAFQRKGQ